MSPAKRDAGARWPTTGEQMHAFWGRWVTVRTDPSKADQTGFVRRTETRKDGVYLDLIAVDFTEPTWVHINDIVRVVPRAEEPR